jgi:hypothetical protein
MPPQVKFNIGPYGMIFKNYYFKPFVLIGNLGLLQRYNRNIVESSVKHHKKLTNQDCRNRRA